MRMKVDTLFLSVRLRLGADTLLITQSSNIRPGFPHSDPAITPGALPPEFPS